MKIERLFRYCLLAGTFLLASCSNEDVTDNPVETLPEGMYPLELTASVQAGLPVTRVSEDQSGESKWDGNEIVKVKIEAETKDYKTDASGSLTSTQPFYWNSTNEIKQVTAWYPAALTFNSQLKDQSTAAKYMACDVLRADQTPISYTDTKKELTFNHKMAKVIINLMQSDGTTAMTDATSVEILCNKDFTYSEGGFTNSNAFDYVSPFRPENNSNTYKAMIIPQDMAGKLFIKVVWNGNTYYWTPATDEANLTAGKAYTYTITVKANGIEVTAETSGQWDSKGEELVKSDIIYTAADLKPGDYFYRTTGGEWAVSDGGLRKIYADGTTEWESDKTPDNNKGTCIGIVLKVGRDTEGNWADSCDYKLKGSTTSMSEVHGYVLALRDANGGNLCPWGSYGTEVGCDRNPDTGFNGYSNTQTIVAKAQGGDLQDAFPAAYYATTGYEAQYPAPDNTSGWFLPSGGQCQYWLNNKNVILRNIQNAGGDGWQNWYWSSSEYSDSPAYRAYHLVMNYSLMDYSLKNYNNAVRACLAF